MLHAARVLTTFALYVHHALLLVLRAKPAKLYAWNIEKGMLNAIKVLTLCGVGSRHFKLCRLRRWVTDGFTVYRHVRVVRVDMSMRRQTFDASTNVDKRRCVDMSIYIKHTSTFGQVRNAEARR